MLTYALIVCTHLFGQPVCLYACADDFPHMFTFDFDCRLIFLNFEGAHSVQWLATGGGILI